MSNRLILTRGIPASGKSVWSREYVRSHDDAVRVSRDDVRRMLVGPDRMWSMNPDFEKSVTEIVESAVKQNLAQGKTVILDATNLKAKDVKKWYDIWDDVTFRDFPIDVDVAIERDKNRSPSVGVDVIRMFAKRYNANGKLPLAPAPLIEAPLNVKPYVPNPYLNAAYIFDIDGTLAHVAEGGRSHYDYSRVNEDILDEPVANLLKTLWHSARIILVSGREDYCREDTMKWLAKNYVYYHTELLMRKTGDHRRDDVVKLEIFNKSIRDKYNVLGVFDDRDRCVKMWRSLGLKCMQVAEGNF